MIEVQKYEELKEETKSRTEQYEAEKGKKVEKVLIAGAVVTAGIVSFGAGCMVGKTDGKSPLIKTANAESSKRIVESIPEVKKKEDYSNEEIYRFIIKDGVPAYPIANAPEGTEVLSSIKLKINDRVRLLAEDGNSSKIEFNGLQGWVDSNFLFEEEVPSFLLKGSEVKYSEYENELAAQEEVNLEFDDGENVPETLEGENVDSSTNQNEEITSDETNVDSSTNQNEEITSDETNVDSSTNQNEEITSDETNVDVPSNENESSSHPCDYKGHDEYICVEGFVPLEGDIDEITRKVTALDIFLDKEAVNLDKGQGVVIGESRGNGMTSILGTNIHKKQTQAVVPNNALKTHQTEHNDDECNDCLAPGDYGKFSDAYAITKTDATIYKDACNDLNVVKVLPAYTSVYIKHDVPGERKPVSLDGGRTFIGYTLEEDIEVDRRNTELLYLKTGDTMTRSTTKEIVAKGYGHDSSKSVVIPAFINVEVWVKSSDSLEVAIRYNDTTLLVSVSDAIEAGIL